MSGDRLQHAINHGQNGRVATLLANGADPNGRNYLGCPFLVTAAGSGNVRMVKDLLRAGARTDAADETGSTALSTAAIFQRHSVLRALIEAGARLTDSHPDKRAMHTAILAESLPVVKELILAGADLAYANPSDFGRCPLHAAAAYGLASIARHLLLAGADPDRVDSTGCTALYCAAFFGRTMCVRELLSAGADMMLENNDGSTALEASCQEGHVAVVGDLIAHGVLSASSASPLVAFKALAGACRNERLEVVEALLSSGVPATREGFDGSSPIASAVLAGNVPIAKLLFSAGGIDIVKERDVYGTTPLISAAGASHPRMVAFLLAVGADPTERKNCGCTALSSIGRHLKEDDEREEADVHSVLLIQDMILRGAAYQATSWLWLSSSGTVQPRKRGAMKADTWPERRRRGLLSVIFRYASKPDTYVSEKYLGHSHHQH